ncbi:hypothetical protein [Phyllobacterium sp. K27]
MPFTKRDSNYDETEWRMMELAYVRACEILRVDHKFYAYRNDLARHVMKLFNSGIRETELLAKAAAESDRNLLAEFETENSSTAN